MQQLTCKLCNKAWERESKRGRPPVVCPDCKNPGKAPERPQVKSKAPPGPASQGVPKTAPVILDDLPFSQRTSGWCTDYDLGPVAQHERCDGDLGKYRCKCDCHGWT
jgi:hypothetical protein